MITIIVLLILAGVTIATLTGDSGLLTKAGQAKEKSEESEICEQIKLAYLDYEMAKLKNNNLDGKEYLKNSLEIIYGENSINEVKEKNGKYTITMQDDSIYKYDTKIGEAYKYIDVINYNGKTRNTLVAGDNILIGTEKFKVFSKDDTEIKAMPYYNLVTVIADGKVKQGPAVEGTSTEIKTAFASSIYWTQGEDAINIGDSRNNIIQYITAYQTTLEGLGAREINLRAAKYSEMTSDEINYLHINPSRNGSTFWLGSTANISGVYLVSDVYIFDRPYNYSFGVRPILVIEY